MIKGSEIFSSDNYSENELAETLRAELYTRIYKWASEDFSTTCDIKNLSDEIYEWAVSVEKRILRMSLILANHKHSIPLHYHAGAGPQVGGTVTMPPSDSKSIKWTITNPPFSKYTNTTGAKSNLEKNKIDNNRDVKIGDTEYGKTGRLAVIPILKNKYNKIVTSSL